MYDAQVVVRNIARRLEADAAQVLVFWLSAPRGRRAFACEFLESRGTAPIVPLVVRGSLFQNANGVLDDLAQLISENEAAFRLLPTGDGGPVRRCAVLLLAHNEFALPQVSSPAVLPDWFPVGGGRELTLTIEDLTWKLEAPLDAVVRTELLSAALLRLELALLRRIDDVRARDHRLPNAFFDLIRRDKEALADFLAGAHAEIATVRADTFRPSVRAGRSLTARLWQLVRKTTPDQLNERAKALAQALAFPDALSRVPHEALFAVVGRPTHEVIPQSVWVARNILASVFSACQLLTAVHHAGDYAEYPVPLMRSVAFDLLNALETSEETVTRA